MQTKKFNFFSVIPQVLLDIFLVYLSYGIAFLLRFETRIPKPYLDAFFGQIPIIAIITVVIFALFKFYNTMWKFASVDELLQILFAVFISSLIALLMGFTVAPLRFPFTVYIIGCLLYTSQYIEPYAELFEA